MASTHLFSLTGCPSAHAPTDSPDEGPSPPHSRRLSWNTPALSLRSLSANAGNEPGTPPSLARIPRSSTSWRSEALQAQQQQLDDRVGDLLMRKALNVVSVQGMGGGSAAAAPAARALPQGRLTPPLPPWECSALKPDNRSSSLPAPPEHEPRMAFLAGGTICGLSPPPVLPLGRVTSALPALAPPAPLLLPPPACDPPGSAAAAAASAARTVSLPSEQQPSLRRLTEHGPPGWEPCYEPPQPQQQPSLAPPPLPSFAFPAHPKLPRPPSELSRASWEADGSSRSASPWPSPSPSPKPLPPVSSFLLAHPGLNGGPGGGPLGVDRLHNPLYKTELCRSWEQAGFCRYGDKCQFSHGPQELRLTQRHPKYKTKVCHTFVCTGMCPYGARCRFIHSEQPSMPEQVI